LHGNSHGGSWARNSTFNYQEVALIIYSSVKQSNWMILGILLILAAGCAKAPLTLEIKDMQTAYPPGTIISAATKTPVSVEELYADLETVRVVYVGERHTSTDHHDIQLRILKHLSEQKTDISVGMEMFDRTYQAVLDDWAAGNLETGLFLERSHWDANWKYDYELYRQILEFVKTRQIPLVALNIPFHIPPKIAAGGADSLSESDRSHLPQNIDTSDAAHRAYLENIFKHHSFKKEKKFEYFYEAQCVWEDTMAESIAMNLGTGSMVVIVGNGHIREKYGVPNRAYARTQAPFRTIMPTSARRGSISLSQADYIWITE
jgi:uncharacterized iron-regulated protein